MERGTGGVWKFLLEQHEDLLREMLIEAGTTEEKEIGETLRHLRDLWPLACKVIHDHTTDPLVYREGDLSPKSSAAFSVLRRFATSVRPGKAWKISGGEARFLDVDNVVNP
ncbi:hypothetical protein L202_06214 [Cryptococcus amylolentus CBS 6039]|uniref:Uncharacterized protein n=1 Tax=Cryptococcus amylolentus CBS 6039 TaxID=1295533 RepID=A0A1E3HJH6_9TREE|nr:hypothetical protein L202_06214 [Cryptococcus amylolentus CBS 6039]ODN76285.1 hypothetical protein L202_06214 [Cryptococcus amylolentus CBS 6039]